MRQPGLRGRVQRAIVIGAVAVGGLVTGILATQDSGVGSGVIPSTTVANEWVNLTAGSTPRRLSTASAFADAAGCNSTCAYSTLSSAYQAASCGDSILVKAGTYSAQTIPETVTKSCSTGCHLARSFPDGTSQTQDLTGCVFFQPESGSTVVFPSGSCTTSCAGASSALVVNASYVYMKGFTLRGSNYPSTSSVRELGLYVNNVNLSGATNCTNSFVHEAVFDTFTGGAEWYDVGTDNVAIINGDWGPAWQSTNGLGVSSQVSDCLDPNDPPLAPTWRQNTRFQFVGNTMHDYVNPVGISGVHGECIHFNGGSNWIIAKNRFLNCSYNPIAWQGDDTHFSPSITNGLVENNIFGDPCSDLAAPGAPASSCAVVENGGLTVRCLLAGNTTNLTFRFNTMVRPMDFSSSQPCTGTGFQIYGNIGTTPADSHYPASWGSGYNLRTTWGGSLGTGDVLSASSIDAMFTNDAARTWDYSLSSTGLSAVPFVSCGGGYTCPSTDLAGTARNALLSRAGAYEQQSNKGTGGSTASCSPSPCTQGNTVTRTVSVADADTNPRTVSRAYYVERPNNLTNSSSNLVPLVIHAGCPAATPGGASPSGCTIAPDTSGWQSQSATEKYVMLYFPPTHNCSGVCQFAKPTVQTITGIDTDCGTNNATQCDDIPWVAAAIAATITAENIDPNKIFITGESKGGQWSEDVICDIRTSSYIRAASVVSNSTYPISTSTSNDQTVKWSCPAILGTSNGTVGGGAAGLAANTDMSVQFVYGDNDSTACGTLPATCLNAGATRSDGRWAFGGWQLAGDTTGSLPSPSTTAGSTGNIGSRLGCSGTPSSTSQPTTHVFVRTYTGCTVSLRATETVRLAGGGHTACSAPVDSFNCALSGWNFMKAH